MAAALAVHGSAIVLAGMKHEAPPADLSDIPLAVVEATLEAEPEPTPPPEEIIVPIPEPEPEQTPEFREESTPPPKVRPQKVAPIKAPQVGRPGTLSISNAKALAVYSPRPAYPYEARSRHIMGSGVCVVEVDSASGRVTSATMAQSIGNPILDNSAVSAFRQWRFKPGTVSKVRIPITFTMAGASY